jgi:hypothetical protein
MLHFPPQRTQSAQSRIGFRTFGFLCDLSALCGGFLGLPK